MAITGARLVRSFFFFPLSFRLQFSMSIFRTLRLCCVALALVACDGGEIVEDAGTVRDASLRDAALTEAGPPQVDAGSVADAGAPLCAFGTCDPRTGDGCGAMEQCVLEGREATCESVTEPGMLAPGSECTASRECAQGAACFQIEGVGRCARVCCPGDDSECDTDYRCGGSGSLSDGTATEWGRCVMRSTCDVLDPSTSCASREGCYIIDAEGTTECRIAGTLGAGERCAAQEECAGGFFCGGLMPARTCRRICDLELDDCPPSEGTCVQQGHSPDGSGICTLDMATREAMAMDR